MYNVYDTVYSIIYYLEFLRGLLK